MKDPRAGGTIYIWTLGSDKGVHEIARGFGHDAVFQDLMARSPESLRLAVACQIEDRELVESLRGTAIDAADVVWLTAAASRNRSAAARLMLDAGWPASGEGQGATPLHWAAYHGDADLVRALLDKGASPQARDPRYQGTPRDWARHGVDHGGPAAANYAAVLELLS
jgi:hypothetical protein